MDRLYTVYKKTTLLHEYAVKEIHNASCNLAYYRNPAPVRALTCIEVLRITATLRPCLRALIDLHKRIRYTRVAKMDDWWVQGPIDRCISQRGPTEVLKPTGPQGERWARLTESEPDCAAEDGGARQAAPTQRSQRSLPPPQHCPNPAPTTYQWYQVNSFSHMGSHRSEPIGKLCRSACSLILARSFWTGRDVSSAEVHGLHESLARLPSPFEMPVARKEEPDR